MKVLFASAECVPYAKVGGLGDVAGALPKALAALGHDVRVLIPRYGSIATQDFDRHLAPLAVPLGGGQSWCGLHETALPGSTVPVYLLEHDALFGGSGVYEDDGALRGIARFGLLSRAAFQLCRYLQWTPDVIHVHDWPTAILPVMLNTCERGTEFDRTATVLTIHNIAHQPRFPAAAVEVLHVGWEQFKADGLEDHGEINPFKGGCYHATMLTTVSPTYAEEIRSSPGGNGLEHIMQFRAADLVGILNGIDERVWDPATDRHLPAHFDRTDLSGKTACKRIMQQQLGLEVRPEVPLLVVVSRLTPQKGIDVVVEVLDRLLEMDVQIAILGAGDPALEGVLRSRSQHGGGRFYAWVGYNERLAHWFEAAGDFFLMPSRFEPCGLNQMYSQRYGTLPIVRATGGLQDTVEQCDPKTRAGTGFKLDHLTPDSLVNTVRWAVDLFRQDPDLIRAMQIRGMNKDFGWTRAARSYQDVYHWSLERRRGAPWRPW